MRLRYSLIFIALLASAACASELPDLGGSARATLSLADENKVGREIMRQIRSDKEYLSDPVIEGYINNLGRRLVSASPAPYRQIDFFVVQDPTINAFAMPGGHIGIDTGLIAATRTESELAGVMGHEIGHEVQNHIARSVAGQKTGMVAALAGIAVAILAAHSDNPDIAEAALTTSQAYAMQNQLTHTRAHEEEADRVGLQTMYNAGFNPHGMANFFKSLMKEDQVNGSEVPAFLRDHPMSYARMADLQNRIAELPPQKHKDSPQYALIRARVRALMGDPQDAFHDFSVQAKQSDDPATWYGLAVSAVRAGRTDQADRAVSHLEKEEHSAMVDALAAQVLLDTNRVAQALVKLHNSVAQYPDYKPLVYAYARALLRKGQAAKCKSFIEDKQQLWPEDYRLYQLLAEANHALGLRSEEHLAQAEADIKLDQPDQAIEQLQLARQANDGDFFTMSVVEARLRDLKEQRKLDKKENKDQSN